MLLKFQGSQGKFQASENKNVRLRNGFDAILFLVSLLKHFQTPF